MATMTPSNLPDIADHEPLCLQVFLKSRAVDYANERATWIMRRLFRMTPEEREAASNSPEKSIRDEFYQCLDLIDIADGNETGETESLFGLTLRADLDYASAVFEVYGMYRAITGSRNPARATAVHFFEDHADVFAYVPRPDSVLEQEASLLLSWIREQAEASLPKEDTL